MSNMNTHHLPCQAEYWDALGNGSKTFELREDRGYAVGDRLVLYRLDDRGVVQLPPRTLQVVVTYILRDWVPILDSGWVIMAVALWTGLPDPPPSAWTGLAPATPAPAPAEPAYRCGCGWHGDESSTLHGYHPTYNARWCRACPNCRLIFGDHVRLPRPDELPLTCPCGWEGATRDTLRGYHPVYGDVLMEACPKCRRIGRRYGDAQWAYTDGDAQPTEMQAIAREPFYLPKEPWQP